MNDKSCVGNDRLFYFKDDEKLALFYAQKNITCEKKQLYYFHFNALN